MENLEIMKKLKKRVLENQLNDVRVVKEIWNYIKSESCGKRKFIVDGAEVKKHILQKEHRYIKDWQCYIVACGYIWDVSQYNYTLVPLMQTPRRRIIEKLLQKHNLGYSRPFCDLGF